MVKKAKTEIPKIQDKMTKLKSIKNNIFSILLEQLRHKVDENKLIPTLKNSLRMSLILNIVRCLTIPTIII